MDLINSFFDWLEAKEGLLSGLTALAAMLGISYAILTFIFPSAGRAVKRFLGHEIDDQAPAKPSAKKVSSKPSATIGKSSIAVLPLRALSSNEDDRNIAAGLSSEISADLAQVPDLRVASHLASISFQGPNVDLREVAEILSIRYVLTGSFQRHGDRMRLMAELTDAITGEQMWASTYDRELKDLLTVQGEVSEAIVGAISGELKLANTRIAFEAPTQRLDAWGLVQKAFNFWLTSFTQEDYAKSMALLRKAVSIDPEYAGARASLAMILSQRTINGLSGENFEKDRAEALEMIETAVKLGPNDITVLENAGLVWTHHGYTQRARDALQHAIKLAPLGLIAWGYLGFNLGWSGNAKQKEEALSIYERLMTIAPKHPSTPYWNYFKMAPLVAMERFDEALHASDLVIEAQPQFYINYIARANIFGRLGEHEKAREALQTWLAINPCQTPELAAATIRGICTSDELAEPFLCGLRSAGILK